MSPPPLPLHVRLAGLVGWPNNQPRMLVVGLLTIAGMFVLCCGGTLFFLILRPGPTTEVALGEEVRFGDLGVTVASAHVSPYQSTSPGGTLYNHEAALLIAIRFKNYNPNRTIKADCQIDTSTLRDDVGNSYRGIAARDEFGRRRSIVGQVEEGMSRPVRSEKVESDVLVFARPVAGARQLTLTLAARRYGGTGVLRVTIPWAGK